MHWIELKHQYAVHMMMKLNIEAKAISYELNIYIYLQEGVDFLNITEHLRLTYEKELYEM